MPRLSGSYISTKIASMPPARSRSSASGESRDPFDVEWAVFCLAEHILQSFGIGGIARDNQNPIRHRTSRLIIL